MKTSLRNQYGLYERRILWLSDKLQNLLNSDNATMRARKHLFLSAYNTVNNEPTMSLYRYVMEKGAISDNIPKVAMAYTHNHRRKVQDLLKGVLNLILQGAKIHLAYLKLKGFNYTYEQEERKWATRIKAVAKHIIDVDSEVKSKWKSQIENETLAIVRSQKGNDKTTVADAVYSHLSDKYDWRIWLVVIYNATKGPDKQWVQVCGGFYKFGFYGKNIVVASIDTNSTHPIDRHNIYTDLQRVKEVKRYWHWFIGWTTDPLPARSLFEKRLPKYITDPGCKRYPGIGVIIRSANPEYRSPSSHLVVSVKRHYNIHVFAWHCFYRDTCTKDKILICSFGCTTVSGRVEVWPANQLNHHQLDGYCHSNWPS